MTRFFSSFIDELPTEHIRGRMDASPSVDCDTCSTADDRSSTGYSTEGLQELTSKDRIIIWFVVFTGVVGCLANGSILVAWTADKKLRKCSSTFLVRYQICLDFASCALLVVSYVLKLELDDNADRMRRWGDVMCMLIIGDGLVTVAITAATVNLVMIALERYAKIVHSVKHRIYFRR